jgi:hypothetical protein
MLSILIFKSALLILCDQKPVGALQELPLVLGFAATSGKLRDCPYRFNVMGLPSGKER